MLLNLLPVRYLNAVVFALGRRRPCSSGHRVAVRATELDRSRWLANPGHSGGRGHVEGPAHGHPDLPAGLQAIPDEVNEAADVDGATRWQRFLRVTLPLLGPYITMAIILRAIDAFRSSSWLWSWRPRGAGPGDLYLEPLRPPTNDPFHGRGRLHRAVRADSSSSSSCIYAWRTVGRRTEREPQRLAPRRAARPARASPSDPLPPVGPGRDAARPLRSTSSSWSPSPLVSPFFGERPALLVTHPTLRFWMRSSRGGTCGPAPQEPHRRQPDDHGGGRHGRAAAYVIARLPARLRYGLVIGLLITRMFPEFAIGVSVATRFAGVGLVDDYLGLILAHLIGALPFIAWILVGTFEDIPRELEEAAAIDAPPGWGRSSG